MKLKKCRVCYNNKFVKLFSLGNLSYTGKFALEGKKVAIDISIFLYKFKYKSNNLIPMLVEQINKLRIHNITPTYKLLFDGYPSIEKKDVILDRKEKLNFKQSKSRTCKCPWKGN